jgi:hypothetical protein
MDVEACEPPRAARPRIEKKKLPFLPLPPGLRPKGPEELLAVGGELLDADVLETELPSSRGDEVGRLLGAKRGRETGEREEVAEVGERLGARGLGDDGLEVLVREEARVLRRGGGREERQDGEDRSCAHAPHGISARVWLSTRSTSALAGSASGLGNQWRDFPILRGTLPTTCLPRSFPTRRS